MCIRDRPYVGQIQHRARGTVLGSICHGDPTSELPLCFLALNGKIYLKSKKGLRFISANDFYLHCLFLPLFLFVIKCGDLSPQSIRVPSTTLTYVSWVSDSSIRTTPSLPTFE